jgi:hypothetical protein
VAAAMTTMTCCWLTQAICCWPPMRWCPAGCRALGRSFQGLRQKPPRQATHPVCLGQAVVVFMEGRQAAAPRAPAVTPLLPCHPCLHLHHQQRHQTGCCCCHCWHGRPACLLEKGSVRQAGCLHCQHSWCSSLQGGLGRASTKVKAMSATQYCAGEDGIEKIAQVPRTT